MINISNIDQYNSGVILIWGTLLGKYRKLNPDKRDHPCITIEDDMWYLGKRTDGGKLITDSELKYQIKNQISKWISDKNDILKKINTYDV